MKHGRGSKAGTSLLEIIIAFMVLALAIVGTMSLVLAMNVTNTARSQTNVAVKWCEARMEDLQLMPWATMVAQNGQTAWVEGVDWTPPPAAPPASIGQSGRFDIVNVNPANIDDADPNNDTTGAGANTMVRITVTVDTTTTKTTQKPVKVSLVSWRANK